MMKHGSRWILTGALLLAVSSTSSQGGGLVGDLVNRVAPGVGTALDNAHRQVKEAIPPYKAIEEGASRTVNEAFVQSTAPLLQEAIARSRDDALRNGVQPIPAGIRQNLAGFVEERILNVARYRVGGGGDLTLQVNAIRYGEASAITLDYVIVFKNDNDALYNPTLWVHELKHVEQYQDWGMRDFAIRYVRSHQSVENDAYQAETRYAAWVSVRNNSGASNSSPVNRPIAPFQGMGASSVCGTVVGSCPIMGSAPVGTPCWCNTAAGPATGSLVPQFAQAPPTQPMGFPPGFGMKVCGCWGPNPSPSAHEPRCASQSVRVNICPGFCGPGQPLYAYVCN